MSLRVRLICSYTKILSQSIKMKYVIAICLCCSFFACKEEPKKLELTAAEKARILEIKDSIIKAADTKFQQERERKLAIQDSSPIKIIKAWVTENSIGTPEANLTFKNVSSKKIDAIRFAILCYNNFDEPVTNVISGNTFMGMDQDRLSPGRQSTSTWTLNLFDLTTKIKPFVYEVHFVDGSTWKVPD